ncbi:MAG: PA2169 family four-helix-bundle protein [Verrucomicrobiota bacterium JB022]|nr:PA2169 family four-helix-bundle protein [Verrucomicrobiota bacterium JB022]
MEDLADMLVDRLRQLREECRDSAYKLEFTSHHLKSKYPELADRLAQMTEQRRQCAQQLTQRIRSLGHEVEEGGSLMESVSHSWEELRAAIATPKPDHLLDSLIEREQQALDAYDEALQDVMDSTTLQLVLEHRAHFEMCLHELKYVRQDGGQLYPSMSL